MAERENQRSPWRRLNASPLGTSTVCAPRDKKHLSVAVHVVPFGPMSESTPVFEAKRWVEKTLAGGSRSQVFELRDGRYVVVKFPENPQGARVLVNEFVCCSLAEALQLPVNRALLVSIDGRLLKGPQAQGDCPGEFSGGVRCRLVRYPDAVHIAQDQLPRSVENADEIYALDVFDALVARGDGRQLLAYPARPQPNAKKRFAAIDYGFALDGSPAWTVDSVRSLPDPALPNKDPFTGRDHEDGAALESMIARLRNLNKQGIAAALSKIHPPRWDALGEEIQALPDVLERRSRALVEQFDAQYRRQMEVFNE